MRTVLTKYDQLHHTNPHCKPSGFLSEGEEMKNLYVDYYTFSFVRNPYDWLVSLYEYIRGYKDHYLHELFIKMKGFSEYIDYIANEALQTQYSFLSVNGDNESPITLDFVGRLENVNEDFNHIKNHLNLEGDLPHINKSSRTNYQDYYNDETIKIVNEAYARDIEYFGYKFEEL